MLGVLGGRGKGGGKEGRERRGGGGGGGGEGGSGEGEGGREKERGGSSRGEERENLIFTRMCPHVKFEIAVRPELSVTDGALPDIA